MEEDNEYTNNEQDIEQNRATNPRSVQKHERFAQIFRSQSHSIGGCSS